MGSPKSSNSASTPISRVDDWWPSFRIGRRSAFLYMPIIPRANTSHRRRAHFLNSYLRRSRPRSRAKQFQAEFLTHDQRISAFHSMDRRFRDGRASRMAFRQPAGAPYSVLLTDKGPRRSTVESTLSGSFQSSVRYRFRTAGAVVEISQLRPENIVHHV